jgi:hypothetical protein
MTVYRRDSNYPDMCVVLYNGTAYWLDSRLMSLESATRYLREDCGYSLEEIREYLTMLPVEDRR